VTGILWAALGVLGTLGMTAAGDMVSEEVRDRLDHLPHAVLRLAARRLAPEQRASVYEEEWLPELTYILKGDESRPITRLYHGTRFSLGILTSAGRISARLGQPSPLAQANAHDDPALSPEMDLAARTQAILEELDRHRERRGQPVYVLDSDGKTRVLRSL
jgi:hypothetical protein